MLLAFAVSSCVFTELEEEMLIAEGSGTVTMDVRFRPLDATGVGTKAAGDAIKHVESLWVVVYTKDGNLYSKTQVYPDTENKFNYVNSEQSVDNIEVDAPAGSSGFAESKYCHSTFDMTLPIGVYRIYAVANYDLTNVDVASESKLQNISLEWKDDVAKNNAMFGFFTTDASDAPTSFAAPDVNINKSSTSLHAWVRRAASKVTVSFDGSNLYENVYIYIHTVQIKDIPNTCLLGAANTPDAADELIAEGETMYLRTSGSIVNTDGLRITKGVPTGGQSEDAVHSETANALYFYENMQGTDADKHQYNNFDSKDNKPYGTYIEVKGYYVNKTADNASQGPIIYRFMLGKNTTDDFNAERNNHYKVVLKFKNDANDPDWHIEYEPENPEISVPSPMYISYLHGEKLDIPVVVRGGTIQSFNVEIVDNDWYYEGHPRIATTNDVDFNGFLSMVEPEENNDIDMDYAARETDYLKGSSTLLSTSQIKPFKTEELADGTKYIVPVYTRSVSLGQGFSGNNAYIHKERVAKVKFTAVVRRADGTEDELTETIDVIQVKRVVNPAGVWRPYNSTKQFHVVLMESDAVSTDEYATQDQAISFRPTISDGPWAAEIIQGSEWVTISKTDGNYGTDKLEGSTGTEVDFYYRPGSQGSSSETRCGVIRITYHNNTCVHYVFVTQGLAPVAMAASQTKWHLTNVHRKNKEEATPLYEGSMFRYMNTYTAILAENNYRPDTKTGYGYGPFKPIANYDTYGSTGDDSGGYWVKQGNSDNIGVREWPLTYNEYTQDVVNGYMNFGGMEAEYGLRVNYNRTAYYNIDFNDVFPDIMSNAKVATCAQWVELEELERYYGVLYGENSAETKTTADDAYEYPFAGVDGSHTSYEGVSYDRDKGMRGMFVWDRDNLAGRSEGGGHVFFPIGATGHGHRLHYPDWNSSTNTAIQPYEKIGELKYANMSQPLVDEARPLLYDLYLSPGAIYWCRDWVDNSNDTDDEPGYTQYGQNAQDINYHTYDFNTYSEYATWRKFWYYDSGFKISHKSYTQSSDACFIRCVDK